MLYKRNDITYKRSCRTYQMDKYDEINLKDYRKKYAQEILKPILEANDPIIYVDESTFDLWDTKHCSWMNKNKGFSFPIATTRGSSHTLYMAIGNCLIEPYFHQVTPESTNSANFT